MRLLFLFLLLFPIQATAAEKESPFRNPVDFLQKALLDVRVGPGYTATENIRKHSDQRTGTTHGPYPLYDVRIGPVTISNIFNQAGFTRGKSLRLGLLITYTGDSYRPNGLAARNKSLFVGGFAGFNTVTFYGYSDVLNKKAGTIYALRFAPSIFKTKRTEFFAVFEVEHMNQLYVDYFFGIRPYEGNAVIPAYNGVRSTNFSGTLLYLYSISKKFEFLMWGGEKKYGAGVTRSPTVGLSHEYRAGVGWLYRLF